MTADQLIATALAALDQAAGLGAAVARHAAGILRGSRSGGRPETDDAAALEEIARLRAAGRGDNAIGIVARKIASAPNEVAAIKRRLQRKSRQKGFCRAA